MRQHHWLAACLNDRNTRPLLRGAILNHIKPFCPHGHNTRVPGYHPDSQKAKPLGAGTLKGFTFINHLEHGDEVCKV